MTFSAFYSVGTVTLAAGGKVVTGVNTNWAGNVAPGDIFWGPSGLSVRIASVDSATKLTLAQAWPGAAMNDSTYEVWNVLDAVGYQRATRDLLRGLSKGALPPLAEVIPEKNALLYFTETGSADVVPVTELGRALLGVKTKGEAQATLGAASLSGALFTGETTFQATARFETGITVKGGLSATGQLVVGDSADGSWITMRDPGEGDRSIHNNSATIGFVGLHGEWIMRVKDNGDIWSRTWGWMSDRFHAKVDKAGSTMTGDLEIQKTRPSLMLHYPSVSWWKVQVANNGNLFFTNNSTGDDFAFSAGGALWTRQLGDLNTRIETRAREWANDRAQRITARLAFAGDVDAQWGVMSEPYGGAVITGAEGKSQTGGRYRFRYLQMKNIFDQWYTIGYA